MKTGKLISFIVALISMSIVVFNNLNQIINEMFKPSFSLYSYIGFGIVIFVMLSYSIYNLRGTKW